MDVFEFFVDLLCCYHGISLAAISLGGRPIYDNGYEKQIAQLLPRSLPQGDSQIYRVRALLLNYLPQ